MVVRRRPRFKACLFFGWGWLPVIRGVVLAVVPPFGVALALNVLAAAPPAGASASSSPDPAAQWRRCGPGMRFMCCAPASQPCIRSGAARLTLLSVGVAAGAIATGLLFAIGDRYRGGDPATLLVGTGAVAGVGALFGSLVGRLGGDRPNDLDRVRPSTFGLEYRATAPAVLDERSAHSMLLTFAPNYVLPGSGGRIRLFGHFGGRLLPQTEVDPRPQSAMPSGQRDGTAPIALRERQLNTGVGLDLAVWLPYPAARRSNFLGPAQLRWKPEVQIRRDVIEPGSDSEHVIERTMFLPLTVGIRWLLSPRQRFTIYVGPRFDFVAYSEPGSRRVHRGPPMTGALYGEAWYDLDFPMTLRERRDGRSRRAAVNSQLNIGYIHSRFDGNGFNFGPVIGFLGPVQLRWTTRVRPKDWKVALQGGAGVAIGSGFTASANLGVVLPDLGGRR